MIECSDALASRNGLGLFLFFLFSAAFFPNVIKTRSLEIYRKRTTRFGNGVANQRFRAETAIGSLFWTERTQES